MSENNKWPYTFAALSVADVRRRVNALDLADDSLADVIAALRADKRKGVQALADTLTKRLKREAQALQKITEHQTIEREMRAQGYKLICGIDEVGRGPLAGPVVAAAVILSEKSKIIGVDDSKKLSRKKREILNDAILSEAISYGIGEVSPERIDAINILEATKEAMTDAVTKLDPQPDLLLIDALRLPSMIPVRAVVHGDAECYAIGAASIVAKVYRDRLMMAYAEKYPEYGFERNMGYGTAEHVAALKQYGPSPIHRRSFITHFVNG